MKQVPAGSFSLPILHSPPSPAQPSRPHSPLVTTCPLCSHPTVSRTHSPRRSIDTRTRYVHSTQGYTKCWHRCEHTATCTGLQAHTDDTLTYSTQTCTEVCMGVHTGTQKQHTQGHVHTDTHCLFSAVGTYTLQHTPPLLPPSIASTCSVFASTHRVAVTTSSPQL